MKTAKFTVTIEGRSTRVRVQTHHTVTGEAFSLFLVEQFAAQNAVSRLYGGNRGFIIAYQKTHRVFGNVVRFVCEKDKIVSWVNVTDQVIADVSPGWAPVPSVA